MVHTARRKATIGASAILFALCLAGLATYFLVVAILGFMFAFNFSKVDPYITAFEVFTSCLGGAFEAFRQAKSPLGLGGLSSKIWFALIYCVLYPVNIIFAVGIFIKSLQDTFLFVCELFAAILAALLIGIYWNEASNHWNCLRKVMLTLQLLLRVAAVSISMARLTKWEIFHQIFGQYLYIRNMAIVSFECVRAIRDLVIVHADLHASFACCKYHCMQEQVASQILYKLCFIVNESSQTIAHSKKFYLGKRQPTRVFRSIFFFYGRYFGMDLRHCLLWKCQGQ